MYKLGGWQRIGIAASLAWIIGASIYQHMADSQSAHSAAFAFGQLCIESGITTPGFSKWTAQQLPSGKSLQVNGIGRCEFQETEMRHLLMADDLQYVAMLALLPLPFAWLAGYIALRGWRWIGAGFQ